MGLYFWVDIYKIVLLNILINSEMFLATQVADALKYDIFDTHDFLQTSNRGHLRNRNASFLSKGSAFFKVWLL